MILRILAAIFCGTLVGVLLPISTALLIGMPDTFTGFVWFAAIGFLVGGILGARFPRVFEFVFEMFTNV